MTDIKGVERKIAVVGGGASGLFAAYFSAINGNVVTLFEKNEKLGKKIYITGKGRCNVTNDCTPEKYLENVVNNPKFMFSAIYNFTPENVISFFENNGLKLKTERGNRVFPLSDKASDVTKTLEKLLKSAGVDIKLNEEVKEIVSENRKIKGLKTDISEYPFDSVIICTGGVSYPLTGSTGDGYKFAKFSGHTVKELVPALVGIELSGTDHEELQGISLKNVSLTAFSDGKKVYDDFGEMLFTHFGISGPIVLSCSSVLNRLNPKKITFSIDLKPALNGEVLDKRLLREFSGNKDKSVFNAVRSLLPQNLVNLVLRRAAVNNGKICSEITRKERENLAKTLKNLTFSMKGLRGIDEAIVTSGGVSVKEIDPKTMESKICKGLFFAGEVIDVDCFTGGFNMQTAFSTGAQAGRNA